MYCRTCGHRNPQEASYCTNDGTALFQLPKHLQMVKRASQFCPECGGQNGECVTYCGQCGVALQTVETNKAEHTLSRGERRRASEDENAASFSGGGGKWQFNVHMLQKSIVGSGVALGSMLVIVFVLSWLATERLNALMADALADELGAMAGMLSFDGFINMMDMIMMAHFVGFSVVGSGGELAELSMSAQTGLYLYLLVPLVALMIGGFVSAKQNAHFGVFERFNLSVVIGAVYGAVLAVFSLFAGTSMALDMGEFGGPGMDIAVSGQYSFFAALWHGFLLGTIFSFFGALMQFGPPKVTSHLSGRLTYGESLHQAISTVIRGVLLSVFVLLVVFLVQFGGEVFDDTFMFIVLLTQLGGYLWVLLNFIPFSMSADMFGESGALNVSVLSGFEAVGEMGDTAVLNDYGIYLYLGLLLPIALFLWAGYRIRLQVKGDVLKAVLAFSGTYALLMAALATLTAFSFEMNAGSLGVGAEMLEVSIGFGFFTTLFISFITASLLTYAGTLFVKAEE